MNPSGNPFDVAIVGLGPVGAALAVLLGQRGVRVVALDRDMAPHTVPRAAHCGDEAMRVLQACGVADEVLAAGRPIDGFDLVDPSGRVRLRASKRASASFGWPTSTLVHQPTIERALRVQVAAQPTVDVRLGHEITNVEQDADGVRLSGRIRREEFSVRASYAVGCDGARSLVRDAMAVRLDGGRFEQPWLVVDTLLRRDLDLPDRLQQIIDPGRPTTYVPFPGRRRRWEFRLMHGEDEAAMTHPETIRRLLSNHVNPDDVEIERAMVYTFHDLVAERWRIGRLILAGDAAHQMPPFLGEGLGAGFRDVATLSWVLSLVVTGQSDPSLLDAYESERRPRVEAVTRLAARLGRIVSASGSLARLRDAALSAASAVAPIRRRMLVLEVTGPGIRPALRGSGAVPSSVLLPQPILADGRRLDEALGRGFAVIGLDVDAELWAGEAPIWRELNARFVHLEGAARDEIASWAAISRGAVVIRPDRIAFGVYGPDEGASAADDLEKALGR